MSEETPLWFFEMAMLPTGFRASYAVKSVLLDRRTDFQHLQVFETRDFGRMMALDGCVMLTDRDEFIYHEMLVHVPLFSHPRPRRVLVVGGGDGGTLREVARHPGVEEMVLCEIDAGVIEAARDYFPGCAAGFADVRAKIQVADAVGYIEAHKDAFDVILIDSTDPIGPGEGLFSEEFYRNVRRALTDNGIVVAQGESPYMQRETVRNLHARLRKVFGGTRLYQAFIPTYPSGWWSFALAAKGCDPLAPEVLRRIDAAALTTRYHTREVHVAAFALPPFVAELLAP